LDAGWLANTNKQMEQLQLTAGRQMRAEGTVKGAVGRGGPMGAENPTHSGAWAVAY